MLKIGDRLVVNGCQVPAFVERIEKEPNTDRTIIFLDWKEFGKSRVYLHDQNKIWYKWTDCN